MNEGWVSCLEMRYYRRMRAYHERKRLKEKKREKMEGVPKKTPKWIIKMFDELEEIAGTGTSIYVIR